MKEAASKLKRRRAGSRWHGLGRIAGVLLVASTGLLCGTSLERGLAARDIQVDESLWSLERCESLSTPQGKLSLKGTRLYLRMAETENLAVRSVHIEFEAPPAPNYVDVYLRRTSESHLVVRAGSAAAAPNGLYEYRDGRVVSYVPGLKASWGLGGGVLAVETTDGRIRGYLDGELFLDLADPKPRGGHVGVGAGEGPPALVRCVQVQFIDTTPMGDRLLTVIGPYSTSDRLKPWLWALGGALVALGLWLALGVAASRLRGADRVHESNRDAIAHLLLVPSILGLSGTILGLALLTLVRLRQLASGRWLLPAPVDIKRSPQGRAIASLLAAGLAAGLLVVAIRGTSHISLAAASALLGPALLLTAGFVGRVAGIRPLRLAAACRVGFLIGLLWIVCWTLVSPDDPAKGLLPTGAGAIGFLLVCIELLLVLQVSYRQTRRHGTACLLTVCLILIIAELAIRGSPLRVTMAPEWVGAPGFERDDEMFWKYLEAELPERVRECQSAEPCLVMIGGSSTFGIGLDDRSHTLPAQLERLLRKRPETERAVVLNAGVPGYSSFQSLLYFRRFVVPIEPDVLVLHFGENDKEPAHFGFYTDREAWHWLEERPALARDLSSRLSHLRLYMWLRNNVLLVSRLVRQMHWPWMHQRSGPELSLRQSIYQSDFLYLAGESKIGAPSRVPLDDFEGILLDFNREVSAWSGRLLFIPEPSVIALNWMKGGPLVLLGAYHDRMKAVAAGLDTPVVDSLQGISGHLPDEVFLDAIHPTAYGNSLLAQAALKELVEGGLVP